MPDDALADDLATRVNYYSMGTSDSYRNDGDLPIGTVTVAGVIIDPHTARLLCATDTGLADPHEVAYVVARHLSGGDDLDLVELSGTVVSTVFGVVADGWLPLALVTIRGDELAAIAWAASLTAEQLGGES